MRTGQAGTAPFADPAYDERQGQTLRRERRERRAQQRIARDEAAWADPKRRAALYRRYVLTSALPAGVKVLLCLLTLEFGRHLENCFPSRRAMQRFMDLSTKRISTYLRLAVDARWLERVPLNRTDDGELMEVESKGRFTSAWGNRFCIPAGIAAPDHPGWKGPKVWTQRLYAQRGTGTPKVTRG